MLHLTINGYTIIAYGPSDLFDGRTAILGVRRFFDGFEYVVADVQNVEMDKDWPSGHYSRSFEQASKDYLSRVKKV